MTATARTAMVTSTLIDHIRQVDLRVRDIGSSLSFYRDVVGLEVSDRTATTAALAGPDGKVFLTLDSGGVTSPADPRSVGLFHTAFRFPTRPSLGDALARLVAAQLPIGAGDHLVSEALYVDDPDGNGVELYWDRPEEQWPAPQPGAMVPMATLAVDLDGLLADADQDAEGQRVPRGTDVGHVHLQVSDLPRTTAFYGDVLGLDITGSLGDQAGFFSSNGYHHHIGANTWRSRGGKPAGRDRASLDRIVFGVDDERKITTLQKRLGDRGYETNLQQGELSAFDPDGIHLTFAFTG